MQPMNWRQRALGGLVLLLAIALGARVAAELLAPLVPGLAVLILLCAVGWFVIWGRR